MESGLKKVRYVNHIQSRAHGFICICIGVILFISHSSVALADDSSQTKFKKLEPAITSETDFRWLPLSTLNLTLTGVIKGQKNFLAVISEGEGQGKMFMVGETIIPNVKLQAVDSLGAIIIHYGTLERLEFNRKSSVPVTAMPVAPVVEGTTLQPRLFENGLVVAFIPAGAVQYLGNNIFSVKRSLIQEQVRSGDFFSNAKLEPDSSGGFRVTQIIPGSLYDILKLKDGDTISTINGKAFNSAVDLTSLFFEQRNTNKTAQIQIKRGSSLNSFQLSFQ